MLKSFRTSYKFKFSQIVPVFCFVFGLLFCFVYFLFFSWSFDDDDDDRCCCGFEIIIKIHPVKRKRKEEKWLKENRVVECGAASITFHNHLETSIAVTWWLGLTQTKRMRPETGWLYTREEIELGENTESIWCYDRNWGQETTTMVIQSRKRKMAKLVFKRGKEKKNTNTYVYIHNRSASIKTISFWLLA